MKVNSEIFRAYDIRGIVKDELSEELVKNLGKAIGTILLRKGRNKICVCRDGRLSGPDLSKTLIGGIISSGCDVLNIGMAPTPLLYFATFTSGIKDGVMITGSHNPKNYNGFKIVFDQKALTSNSIQEIKSLIMSEDFEEGLGKVDSLSIFDKYLKELKEKISIPKPLKVVLDCGNGVGGTIAPDSFKALGINLKEIFCEVDGNFPNHHPDPGNPKNMVDLSEAVIRESADLGIALDGDGDRLGVVDNLGKIIYPDQYMSLVSEDILKKNINSKIVFDVKCSNQLAKTIKKSGGIPIMSKTGHSYIKSEILNSNAILGGEMSGHIFFNDNWYGFDDGIFSALRLLEIISKLDTTSSEAFKKFPQFFNTPELAIKTTDKDKFNIIEKLKNNYDFFGYERILIDGLRLENKNAWGIARASNTTPTIVLRFEGDTKESLKKIIETFQKALFDIDKRLIINLN